MKQSFYFVISVVMLIFSSSFVQAANPDWVLQKNENGISVYTRTRTGSVVKEVRVVNTVKSSLSGIIGLLMDTKNYPGWIYACIESAPLKVLGDDELYNYQVTDLPWPFSDRDVICHFKIEQDQATHIVTITKTAVPDYIPAKSQLVRVEHFQSAYRLTPVTKDSVRVEMELQIDPGGSIPAWLVNSNIIAGPYKSTVGMIRQLPQYQSETYAYIKEK